MSIVLAQHRLYVAYQVIPDPALLNGELEVLTDVHMVIFSFTVARGINTEKVAIMKHFIFNQTI